MTNGKTNEVRISSAGSKSPITGLESVLDGEGVAQGVAAIEFAAPPHLAIVGAKGDELRGPGGGRALRHGDVLPINLLAGAAVPMVRILCRAIRDSGH